jgi:hypothetical protein
MFFEKENDVLREVEAKLSKSRAAAHAKLALTTPLSRGYKYLKIPDVHVERISAVHEANGEITVNKAKVDKARDGLMKVLVSNPEEAAETFGHIQYRNKIEKLSEFIYKDGDPANAEKCMRTGLKTLKSRGVLTSVVKEMENQAKDLNGLKSAKRPANANN